MNLLTETHTVATYQVDFNRKMTIPSILMLLQDVAWKHANEYKFGYSHLHEKGLFWVLAKMTLKILRYPQWTDTLRLETWSKPPELLTAFRDFDGVDEQGNLYFSASSAWHILSIAGNRPQPLSDLAANFPHLAGRHSIAEKPAKIASPENSTTVAASTVQPGDIDMHRHVNNTRYIQWIIDSFGFDFLQQNSINSMEINFLSQTKANTPYTITTANTGDNTYVSCIFNKETGKELVRAKTTTATS